MESNSCVCVGKHGWSERAAAAVEEEHLAGLQRLLSAATLAGPAVCAPWWVHTCCYQLLLRQRKPLAADSEWFIGNSDCLVCSEQSLYFYVMPADVLSWKKTPTLLTLHTITNALCFAYGHNWHLLPLQRRFQVNTVLEHCASRCLLSNFHCGWI